MVLQIKPIYLLHKKQKKA